MGRHRADGWEPWQYSTMFILCGMVGVVGSPWAGRMGDLYGRRVIAAGMLGLTIDKIRADGTYKAIQDKYFDFDVYGE